MAELTKKIVQDINKAISARDAEIALLKEQLSASRLETASAFRVAAAVTASGYDGEGKLIHVSIPAWGQRVILALTPSACVEEQRKRDVVLIEKERLVLRRVSDLLEKTPELNMSNYNEDDVAQLNSCVIELTLLLRAALDPTPAPMEE